MVETRGTKRRREAQEDNSLPVPAASDVAMQRKLKRMKDQVTSLRAEFAVSKAEVARLTKRNEELEQQVRALREQPARAMPVPEAQARSAVQDAPPVQNQPEERTYYYARDVEMLKGPDRSDRQAMSEFYRRGGKEENRVMWAKPGSDLRRFRPYGPAEPIPREVTPPAEARRHNVDLRNLPDRVYFDVNFNDKDTAVQDYGLMEEKKANSRWEHIVQGDVNKALVRHYSEDDAVKLRAMERWSVLDVTTGVRTPPPARYDPRPHAPRGR